ncbi:MAG: hypothetical protein WCK21_04005, partial [Actinomycetota bacterium]
MYGITPQRSAFAVTLSALAVVTLGLGACSSSTKSSGTTAAHQADLTEPSTSAATTTIVPTTTTTTVTASTTTVTTAKPPTGPTVTGLTTATLHPTCADVTAHNHQVNVSWSAVNVASVTLSIDGLGAFQSGLPASGNYNIPATCGDTQEVYITP